MGFYNGKKVFIVGGSAGIGRETALEMARRGASVAVAARGQERLDETVGAMEGLRVSPGQRFGSISFDVTDRAAVHAAAPEVLTILDGLDVLICNSGYARTGTIAEIDDDAFDQMIDLNFKGHVHATRAFLAHFQTQGSGHICLVSSMLGFFSTYGYGAYSASKYAIVGFAEALRQEMLLHNVDVSIYYPPTTRTPGLELENVGKPPLVWELEENNSFTKTYDADAVGRSLADHVSGGRFEGMIGWDSWIVRKLFQHTPRLARFLADDELGKATKSLAAKG